METLKWRCAVPRSSVTGTTSAPPSRHADATTALPRGTGTSLAAWTGRLGC